MPINFSRIRISNNYLLFFLSTLTILLTGSCSAKENQQEPISNSPTQIIASPTAEPGQIVETSPTPIQLSTTDPEGIPYNPVTPEYDFKVVFDYYGQSAQVVQTIQYVNNSSKAIQEILFACDVLRYPNAFSLEKVIVNSTDEVQLRQHNFYYSFTLDEALNQGEEIQFQIEYKLTVPPLPPPSDDRKPGIFGYSSVQTNFVDWYPFIPPLTEEGEWILQDPWFYGEYLVYDLANYHVEIELNNVPPDTTIAAATIPVDQNENHYVFSAEQARNFVWSLSPSYVIESKEVNGISVSTYTFPFHQQAGSHVLEEASKAIELYSQLFSPYPRESLTIVEADFLDGMEYDGLFFLSRGFFNLFNNSPQDYLTAIAVHETAHQWWYTSVANNQAIEPWLDEALCTYSELLFYEHYYPNLVNWWWAFRVNYYQPEGFINKPIYDYQGFVPYRNATYLQGAKFLQEVRDDLGDQAFFEFIQEYAATQKNKISSEEVFLSILENYLQEDPSLKYSKFLQNKN